MNFFEAFFEVIAPSINQSQLLDDVATFVKLWPIKTA